MRTARCYPRRVPKVTFPNFRTRIGRPRAKRAITFVTNQLAYDAAMERVRAAELASLQKLLERAIERELGLPEGAAAPEQGK